MDLRELKEILRILEEQAITEFELEQDGMKLRICRSNPSNHPASPAAAFVGGAAEASLLTSLQPEAAPPTPPAAPPADAVEAPSVPAEGSSDVQEALVKSPIVGTFYRAPDPNSPPFVDVGDLVRVGQVLCIIEAMKLMNEIEAEVAGQIVRVHAENGQAVQYGDSLFTIRPTA